MQLSYLCFLTCESQAPAVQGEREHPEVRTAQSAEAAGARSEEATSLVFILGRSGQVGRRALGEVMEAGRLILPG